MTDKSFWKPINSVIWAKADNKAVFYADWRRAKATAGNAGLGLRE